MQNYLQKLNKFYSGTLNLKDVHELINHEELNLPLSNILKYADIYTYDKR